jgi:hypothetical protein
VGAIVGDESEAIAEIQALSDKAKGHIAHHVRNSIQGVISALYFDDKAAVEEGLRHIIEDLEKIGC